MLIAVALHGTGDSEEVSYVNCVEREPFAVGSHLTLESRLLYCTDVALLMSKHLGAWNVSLLRYTVCVPLALQVRSVVPMDLDPDKSRKRKQDADDSALDNALAAARSVTSDEPRKRQRATQPLGRGRGSGRAAARGGRAAKVAVPADQASESAGESPSSSDHDEVLEWEALVAEVHEEYLPRRESSGKVRCEAMVGLLVRAISDKVFVCRFLKPTYPPPHTAVFRSILCSTRRSSIRGYKVHALDVRMVLSTVPAPRVLELVFVS